MIPKNISRRQFLHNASSLGVTAMLAGSLPQLRGEEAKEQDETGENPIVEEPTDLGVLGHGDFQYRVVEGWGKLDAEKTPVLNCHEMVMDSQGRLILLTDEVKNNVIIYDKDGSLVESWGTRWPGGHGLTLAKEGDDEFLFISDCGWYHSEGEIWERQSGTVTKTKLDGSVVFTIGHPQTIGVYEEGQSFMPTEVAVAPNGDFYVADGYGSDFILQYNHRGQFVRKFGGHNNSDKKHNLHNAHGVTVDLRDPENPVLICTSRNEHCFKIFTMDGRYLETIPLPGTYPCRAVVAGNNVYAGICWSNKEGIGPRLDKSGFVTILDENNKVISNPGGVKPVYEEGVLKPMHQEGDVFKHCHDVCVDDEDNLYVCQWNAGNSYPIKLERIKG